MYRFANILLVLMLISSCTPTKTIESGEDAFELRQYAVAVVDLEGEFDSANRDEEKARTAYALGRSFQKMNRIEKAAIWYKRAVDYDFGLDAIKELAKSYKQLEQYDAAIFQFRKWKEAGGEPTISMREIAICEQAKLWNQKNNKAAFEIETSKFNSMAADYSPVFYEGRSLVFTSDRESATGETSYNWTGNAFSDLFIVGENQSEARNFSEQINTPDNDGVVCFNKSFDELFFTRCFAEVGDEYCKLLWSIKIDGEWEEPIEPFVMKENVNYGHPTLIENDSVLVFSSNDPDGIGGYDLYYSVREEEGWSPPDIMPERINTQGDEKFPRADADTLYFSSDYLPGMGGLDIFRSFLKASGEWSQPQNMKPPINSGRDDFSFIVNPNFVPTPSVKMQGYFSSSRSEQSNDDIFKFTQIVLEDDPEIAEEEEEEEEENGEQYDVYLVVEIITNRFEEEDNPNSNIVGKKPVPFAFIQSSKDGKKDEDIIKTDRRGRYITQLEWDKDYSFLGIKKGYLNSSKSITTKNIERKKLTENLTINTEIPLDKIYVGMEIVIDNIYYDYNKWDIREDAEPALNKLANILKTNPSISIELASHTDCRGEDDFNFDLSQKRAQSAVSYLIQQGIRATRLQAKGYGETQVRVNCNCDDCTEEEHQQNRRTSFTIVE